ncbi:hypothetical protein ACIGD1_11350 [Streptomyces sp. NPDC085612]|uniref:hypothetical protein n=1 Tax=Streptomyces sp. NPDC085612 TaxID=3365732 RepID=UPI0037D7E283
MTEQPCAHCGKPVPSGGVREWTGPASTPARTWHPACEPCCVCGGGPVTYRNYKEQPFCWPCADCQCAQNPCVRTGINDPAVSEQAAAAAYAKALDTLPPDEAASYIRARLAERGAAAVEQPVRHTADTITAEALDALYAEIERMKLLVAASSEPGHAARMAAAAEQRARQAEAAIDRVRDVFHRIERARREVCGITDPLATGYRIGLNDAEQALHTALDGPKEPTP